MKVIYKYTLVVTDEQAVDMPEAAQILDVQVQADQVCLWALVDPVAPTAPRIIRIVGTGHSVSDADLLRYIATFRISYIARFQTNDVLVFHVFEKLPTAESNTE